MKIEPQSIIRPIVQPCRKDASDRTVGLTPFNKAKALLKAHYTVFAHFVGRYRSKTAVREGALPPLDPPYSRRMIAPTRPKAASTAESQTHIHIDHGKTDAK